LKILFIGNELMAQRLRRTFKKEDIDIILNTSIPSDPELLADKSNLVIIDSTIPEAENICQRVCKLEIVPVVIMVNEAENSWKTICEMNADGFITTGAGDTEVLARVKAIYRRSERAQKILS
jgi:DNA-binding response OmpR family regulator